MSKQRLGKGLQALISDMYPENGADEVRLIEVDRITANPYQPRREFSEQSLQELAQSLRQHGLIQPITVRRSGGGFELVVGERRWRAAQLAGFEEIAAVVKDMNEEQMMEVSIIENLQREDLNPIEEAMAYQQLQENVGYTQEQLAGRVGKSRSYIANTLRLLSLPDDMIVYVSRGTMSPGHARAILAAPEGRRKALLDKILSEQYTVRQAELFAQGAKENVSRETQGAKKNRGLDLHMQDIQSRLREKLQAKVTIHVKGKKGSIEIEYYSEEELERLLELLSI